MPNLVYIHILEGLGIENFGIVHCQSVFLLPFWYDLWPFGILCLSVHSFSHFGLLHQEKSGNPGSHLTCQKLIEYVAT
jgi:hypothetical protein